MIHDFYQTTENDIETGSHKNMERYKTIVYPFGNYEITLKLGPNNEFIEILEVKINKDFLNYQQKMSFITLNSEIDKYYRD